MAGDASRAEDLQERRRRRSHRRRRVALSRDRRALFWLAMLGLTVFAFWLLRSILTPFVLGMAIAYFLDPVADRLQRRGIPRGISAGVIIVSFSGFVVLLIVLLMPTVIEQVSALASAIPRYFSASVDAVRPWLQKMLARMSVSQSGDLSQPLALAQNAAGLVGSMLNTAVERGFALVNSLVLLAVTPLVAFYLLRDWEKIVDAVDGWLPRTQAGVIREQLHEIDVVLAGFARGTATVCLVLGAFYAVSLTLAGLNFGLVIGLAAGFVSFIPYVGTLFGLTASVGVALFQFWPDWMRIALVAFVFFAGQLMNDYVLIPRLVGKSVGLHPLWVMFGLFAGGALFGFVGLLIAVPVCAVVGVLTRFALSRYKESPLYLGTDSH